MVDVAPPDVVVVLTRAPSAGGKTRLFAALGRPPDPALLTALLLDTLDGVRGAGVRLLVAVTPAAAREEVARLTGADVFAQQEGDIGARMHAAMREAFARGARRVALIGADLPSISGTHIASAFAALDAEPDALVLGPALDGGYYLVAASRLPPVFHGIEWSRADVLARTQDAAARAGITVALLTPLGDVDTVADLQRLTDSSPRSRAWTLANGIASSRGNVT